MNRILVVAALFAGALFAGCSSNGTPGPIGPTGPKGDPGIQGGQGQPGESVLSVALGVGSLACPNGGSQFTSASGTTSACNGDTGPQGVSGPSGPPGATGAGSARFLLKTANGDVIGQALPWSGGGGIGPSMMVGFTVTPGFAVLNPVTGRLAQRNGADNVYFDQPDCSGNAVMSSGILGGVYENESSNRLFVITTTATAPFIYRSRFETTCLTGFGATVLATSQPVSEVVTAPYPFALPLQLSFE